MITLFQVNVICAVIYCCGFCGAVPVMRETGGTQTEWAPSIGREAYRQDEWRYLGRKGVADLVTPFLARVCCRGTVILEEDRDILEDISRELGRDVKGELCQRYHGTGARSQEEETRIPGPPHSNTINQVIFVEVPEEFTRVPPPPPPSPVQTVLYVLPPENTHVVKVIHMEHENTRGDPAVTYLTSS